MYNMFSKVRKQLSLMNISNEFKSLYIKNRIVDMLYTSFLSYMTLFLQYANEALQKNETYIAMFFLVLFLSRDLIRAIARAFLDELREQLHEKRNYEFDQNYHEVLSNVLGKIVKSENGVEKEMPLITARQSLENYWMYIYMMAERITTIVTFAICILILMFNMAGNMVGKFDWTIIIGIFAIRGWLVHHYAKKVKPIEDQEKKMAEKRRIKDNDIENVSSLSKSHFMYMVDKYLNAKSKEMKLRADGRKINRKEDYLHASITVGFIMWIFGAQVSSQGLTTQTLVSIMASITAYNEMIHKLEAGLWDYGKIVEYKNKIKRYADDTDLIYEAYEKQKNKKSRQNHISEIQVQPFEFSYSDNYVLKVKETISLEAGKINLFKGPTGSGKSTIMEIIAGQLKVNNKVKYLPEEDAETQTLIHNAQDGLGSGNALEEICFSENYDKAKLKEILEGLNLYQEIQEKQIDVFEYLANNQKDNFSTGQQQRLVIARLLYNLQPNVEIIVLDEATNALNDAIVEKTLNFALGYIQKDRKRICCIASHQVNVAEKFADKIYEVESLGNAEFELKCEK